MSNIHHKQQECHGVFCVLFAVLCGSISAVFIGSAVAGTPLPARAVDEVASSQLLCWRTIYEGTCCDAFVIVPQCEGCLCLLQPQVISDGGVFALTPTDGDGWRALEFGHEDVKCAWIPVLCNYTGVGACCIARPDLQQSARCTRFINPSKPTTCP